MDRIVDGIAQINFYQNLGGITNENSAPNESSSRMSGCDINFCNSEEPTNVSDEDKRNLNLSEEENIGDSGWVEIDEDLEKGRRKRKGFTLGERRQMPTRASKESSLMGIKRRTIMKPAKRVKNSEDFQNLKPADIKKIYLNKKLANFKPSHLETIFEETSTIHNYEQGCTHLMGGRKIKRTLSFSDGFRYSKTLVKKRRAKIKQTFGKRFALKKISLEDFITKLDTSIEQNEDKNHDCQMQDEKMDGKEFSRSDIFILNTSLILDEAKTANKLP